MSFNYTNLDLDAYTYEYFLQTDVCRFCWNKNAIIEIISKNMDNNCIIKNEVEDKIRNCLDIDLTEESFPNKACEKCYGQIENFNDFKNFCKETNRRLQEILHRRNHDLAPLCENTCLVKLENNSGEDVNRTECLSSLIDSSQHSDTTSDLEIHSKPIKNGKSNIKSKYKPKRSPTYCNICRKDMKTAENLSIHNSKYHGIEDGGMYKCFGCDKRFKNPKNRLGHEINYCKGLKDGYKCTICERYLPKRRVYESHMRNHRNNISVELPEDIFKCIKCYKLFMTRESLKTHMAVHKADKSYVCESCGRVFTRQDYLNKHILTHTGIKQHVCPHCGFRTTQRSSLTVHIRKHTGERPYICDVCPQRCVSSSNLRAHRRRHLALKKYEEGKRASVSSDGKQLTPPIGICDTTGITEALPAFKCTICGKKFGYKISLEEHIASTHERSRSHPCPHCGAVYSRVRGLRRHLLAKHGKSKEKDNPKLLEYMKNDEETDKSLKVAAESRALNGNGLDNMLDAVKDVDDPKFALQNQNNSVFVVYVDGKSLDMPS